jgi:4-hydroxy 2-oxovalerate aldolase
LEGKNVLVIGPGISIKNETEKIIAFINNNTPTIISINFLPEFLDANYLFLTNSKRYVQQAVKINTVGNTIKIIATSNVTKSAGIFDYNLDYETLIDRNAVFMDNSFIMLLKVLKKTGIKDVTLAGFDGYSQDRETNYYLSKMEYDFAKQRGEEINENVNQMLSEFRKYLNIKFITTTLYKY